MKMAQHFVTVCVVCVLCAAHTPCYAHMNVSSSPVTKQISSEKYTTESLGYNKHLLPFKTETTVLPPQLKDFHTKNPLKILNLKQTLNKVPDDKIESSILNDESKFEQKNENKKSILDEVLEKQHELFNNQLKLIEKQKDLLKNQKYLLEQHAASKELKDEQIEGINSQIQLLESQEQSLKKQIHLLDDDFNLLQDISNNPNRNVENSSKNKSKLNQYFIKKISEHFGNVDGKMTMDSFDKLAMVMGLFQTESKINEHEIHSIDSYQSENHLANVEDLRNNKESTSTRQNLDEKETCLSSRELLGALSGNETYKKANKNATLPNWLFESVCPALVYQFTTVTGPERSGCLLISDNDSILSNAHNLNQTMNPNDLYLVWGYASFSVLVISLVGVVGIAVIPLTSKSYYSHVLQFLVALAVGTLCGDALIHLIPHAMMEESEAHVHSHDHDELHLNTKLSEDQQHTLNIWKGLTVVIGVVAFFIMEKALNIMSEWWKYRKNRRKMPVRVRVMRESDAGDSNNVVGEKLCKHKYSTYPYCYGEIASETQDDRHCFKHNNCEKPQTIDEEKHLTCNSTNSNSISNKIMQSDMEKKNNDDYDTVIINDTKKKAIDGSDIPLNDADGYTVIIRDHDAKHHGHGHTHNHVHSAPNSMSSVAMMVIMGDGLHNFTDGMAIGAAFYGSLGGGFSTALAVLCHELPHELGDFAVLLKTGMSVRQAVFYNVLSSILCFMGMICGIMFGAVFHGIGWVFALTAGIFLYIALVDMMPELSSNHSIKESAHWHFLIQSSGMITGFALMLIIALFEHDLQDTFTNTHEKV